MAYTQQEWYDGDPATPLSGARLTHIESGIGAADAAIEDLLTRVTALEGGGV